MYEFLQENWLYISLAAYAALSECMPFVKRVESNGVLQFLFLFVGKLLRK